MNNFLKIQQKLIPQVVEIMTKRYSILRQIYLCETIGRRSLAGVLKLSERVIRSETEVLREQGLIKVETSGMTITEEGIELLEQLKDTMNEVMGLSTLQEKVKNKEYVSNFKVRYSDIDFNKHVNNVKYVQWFMDSVPQEIREEYELKEIDILFEHECYYNDEIKCVCEIHKNEDNLLVLSNIQDKDGKELTVFVSKWQ